MLWLSELCPYNAILSDITSDYNERTSFTTLRMIFSGAAALLSAVIPSIIIKSIGGGQNGPQQIPGYLVMALIFGALFIFYIDIVVLQYQNYELVVGTLLVCSMLLVAVQSKFACSSRLKTRLPSGVLTLY